MLSGLDPAHIVLGLAGLNLWTFACFAWDKRQARNREWRVAESSLLVLALLGGTPAAFAARSVLRHKTRKQPFTARLWAIAAIQSAALAWAAVAWA